MKIILSETKFSFLMTHMINETISPNLSSLMIKADKALNVLKKLIQSDGVIMQNIENGKEYIVYEIYSLTNIIGKKIGICQLYKDGAPYGSLYVKSMDLFKMKNY
jgi:hypothetical protein